MGGRRGRRARMRGDQRGQCVVGRRHRPDRGRRRDNGHRGLGDHRDLRCRRGGGGGRGQTGRDAGRARSGAARAADRGGRRGCSVGRETRDKAGDRVRDMRAGHEGERPGDVRRPHEATVRLPALAAGAEMREVCASQSFRRLEQPAPDLAARIGCRVMRAQERQPRTAEERLDRRRRRLEHVGDLVLRQTAPVAKDEGMMLGLGQRPEHPAHLGELRRFVAGSVT